MKFIQAIILLRLENINIKKISGLNLVTIFLFIVALKKTLSGQYESEKSAWLYLIWRSDLDMASPLITSLSQSISESIFFRPRKERNAPCIACFGSQTHSNKLFTLKYVVFNHGDSIHVAILVMI